MGTISLAKYQELPELSFEKSEYTIILGETFTAPTLINPSGVTVTYSSSNEKVATVNEETGEVTIKENVLGSAIITVTSVPTDTYGSSTASYTITIVPPDNDDVFVLADNLFPGDQIIIVNVTGTDYMGMSDDKGNNRDAIRVNANEDGTLKGNSKLQVITLETATTDEETNEGTQTFWWLNVGNGYLFAASSDNNHLKTEENADDNAKAAITFGENSVANIIFQGNNTNNVLKFNFNNGSPLFSCYDPNSQQLPVKIYHKKAALLGDANNDGIVNVTDVMLVVCYTVNGRDGLDINLRNADFNEDGQVNITDAMAILPLAINY